MFEIEIFSKKQILPIALVLIIGGCIGWLSFVLLGDTASYSRILYISKAEILKYEKDRIANINKSNVNDTYRHPNYFKDEDKLLTQYLPNASAGSYTNDIPVLEKKMFFGRIHEAISLIESIGNKKAGKNSAVIFVNDEFVKGNNTTSISKIVYEEILVHLRNQN